MRYVRVRLPDPTCPHSAPAGAVLEVYQAYSNGDITVEVHDAPYTRVVRLWPGEYDWMSELELAVQEVVGG